MSLYKPKGSPYYQFDFQWRGTRFHSSTKKTDKREAQAVEKAERERVKQNASVTTNAGMTLDRAAVALMVCAEANVDNIKLGARAWP